MKLNHANPIETKKDYQQLIKTLVAPLEKYFVQEHTLLNLGDTGTVYDEKTREIEAFARPLWGLAPFWAGGEEEDLASVYLEGIRKGTNPNHPSYWGVYGDYHQIYVEMAAMALGLLLAPDKLWDPLSDEEKKNLGAWLRQINGKSIVTNNWQFFRVLVNIALKKVGATYSQEAIDDSIAVVEACYLGDGWYSDGQTPQKDYYVAFAIHFYSLIYAKYMKEEDPQRSQLFVARAKLFAKDFMYWFTDEGDALPFGRSQTYRFAQCAFFSALAFADVEVLEWGVVKGIVNRHIRWWMQQPIFNHEGLLTIGYRYGNLHMSEGYNGDGSPYWAFKAFLMLALDETHPFWQAEELPLPELEQTKCLMHPQMIIQRPEKGHIIALTSGQYADFEPVHVAEKYAKFAYSSALGFNVPRSYFTLDQLAPDNMLAFKKDGLYFVRRRCIEVKVTEQSIYSKWEPLEGVMVETLIKPEDKGHTRLHRIHSQYTLEAVEGGFALPCDYYPLPAYPCEKDAVTIEIDEYLSHMTLRRGEGRANYTLCEANTNVMYPRTVLPYISYTINKGITEIEVYVEGRKK